MKHSIKIAGLACAAILVLHSQAFAQLGGGKGGPSASMTGSVMTETASCTVDAVSALTFTCSGGSGKATYSVDAATAFSPAGSTIKSLKVGAAVQVTYHNSGNTLQADSVAIQ